MQEKENLDEKQVWYPSEADNFSSAKWVYNKVEEVLFVFMFWRVDFLKLLFQTA